MEEDNKKAELKARLKTSLEHRDEASGRLRDNHRMEGIAYGRAKETEKEIKALGHELGIIDDAMDEILDVDGVYVELDELVGLEKERWDIILDKKIKYETEIKELKYKKWMYDLVMERYKRKGNVLRARESKMTEKYYTLRKIVNADKAESKSSKSAWNKACKHMLFGGSIIALIALLLMILDNFGIPIGREYIPVLTITGTIFIGSAIVLDTVGK